MPIRPYTLAIPDAALADLAQRLANARWADALDSDSWADGTNPAYLARVISHWRERFDWRAQEQRLNRLPQFITEVDGQGIHFIHQRGRGPAPLPLVITHGWPGSFIEIEPLLPLLADPAAHGGDAADAFDVVVPSLPGYGASPAPRQAGTGSRRIASLWQGLMAQLGYPRFGAQGGDIGAGVGLWLAREHAEQVLGVHLNYVPASFRPPLGEGQPPLSSEEQAYLERLAAFAASEGAYALLQGTKPQTLAFALADSPLGLAAWIIEKFHAWSDHGGDLEQVLDLDTVLTDISLYWFSASLQASLRLYKENRQQPLAFYPGERPQVPLGVALFPKELPMPPRSWLARSFDVQRWDYQRKGGHFAALEQPQLLAEEIRAFFRPLRSSLIAV